eukprot:g1484.t1
MANAVVLYEKRGHVAIFTLNRPRAMNAVNHEVSQQFEKAMDDFENDDQMWIGIVRSSHPKVFCAGADLKAISGGKRIETKRGGFAGFVKYPRKKPMIAAIDGYCLAGGFEIALSCDFIVASRKSKFGLPEVKRSLVAAAGGLFRLPSKVPRAIAMEILLTGDPIDSEKAHRFGLVNEVVPDGFAFEAALRFSDRILVNAPLAVREAKACVDEIMEEGMKEEDAFQRSTAGMMALMGTPDFREGPRAFIEKRKPRWTGRRSKL